MPKLNIKRHNIPNIDNIITELTGTCNTINTIIIGIVDNNKLTTAVKILEIGYISKGTYTLEISAPFPTIELIAEFVASEKNEKHTNPINKYAIKYGISVLNNVENTKYNTSIVKTGFNKLHIIPKILLLYFVLKSLITSCDNKNLYLFTLSKYLYL